MKAPTATLTPDECRGKVLAYLYGVNASSRGVKAAEKNFTEIRAAMKLQGLNQAQVSTSINYLKDFGWIVELSRSRTFRTKGGTVRDAESIKYRITAKGIQEFEDKSKYDSASASPTIHVTNGNGTVVVGNGNQVSVQNSTALNELDKFLEAVKKSESLDDDDKADIEADVQTMKAQLAKRNPDSSIISKVWSGIEKVAIVPDLIQFGSLVVAALTALGHWPK